MTSDEKKATLLSLLDNWEDEVVEFKSGGKSFSSDEIGKYFSALSNEANLRGLEAAWLVFGVHNKTRRIIGTELIDYIGKFNGLSRKRINDYMIPEIRGELSIEEKITKISNLMTYLRRLGEITNMGSATKPLWKLSDKR
jgi:ATP-dependent DNA helicase RecG